MTFVPIDFIRERIRCHACELIVEAAERAASVTAPDNTISRPATKIEALTVMELAMTQMIFAYAGGDRERMLAMAAELHEHVRILLITTDGNVHDEPGRTQ